MNERLRRMTDRIGRGRRAVVDGATDPDTVSHPVELVELVTPDGRLTVAGAEYLLGDTRYVGVKWPARPPVDDGPADNWGGW